VAHEEQRAAHMVSERLWAAKHAAHTAALESASQRKLDSLAADGNSSDETEPPLRTVCRGAWACVTIDRSRHLSLSIKKHRASTNMFSTGVRLAGGVACRGAAEQVRRGAPGGVGTCHDRPI
jgi:hypothetical protein